MDDIFVEPLNSFKEYFEKANSVDFQIKSLGYTSQLNLRLCSTELGLLKVKLGISIPEIANTYASNDYAKILCLGPDEWLLISDLHNKEKISKVLEGFNYKEKYSITDVSFNRVIIEISGEKCNELIKSIASVPESAFITGACTQSIFANTQVILLCLENNYKYNILVRSSFSEYLSEVILDQIKFI
tara:strand:+ start:864 stop:1424 length:561 start_codon:yes stop_codon:yes gene_type:complete